MIDILAKIAAHKRLEVDDLRIDLPESVLRRRLGESRNAESHRFHRALSCGSGVRIIAEIKRGSPSKGLIRPDLDAPKTARLYSDGGAAAVSVLTDSRFFHGGFEDLAAVAEAVPELPRLCKDFLVDGYQLPYARLHGADAVLLIAALHSARAMSDLMVEADELGMDCLVEVHDEPELAKAQEAGARIIGVNSRDLRDFTVNLETAEHLADRMGDDVIKVAESGIGGVEDIARLKKCGYNCFLIGEALVTAADPVGVLRELSGA